MLRFSVEPADASPARELIVGMIEDLEPLYGRIDIPGAPSASATDFSPPGGAFVVGWEGDRPICGGGVKRLTEDTCEIKRMYVVPDARGRGVARALLGALERAGAELGYTFARLDTGPQQPHARALYESAGYRTVEDYNGNPFADYWGERELPPPGPPARRL